MNPETDKRSTPWGFRNPVHALVLAVSTCAGIGLCLALATPFLQSFTWAFTLAILVFPLHSRLEARLRNRNLAALLIVLLAALIVVLPLALIARQLVVQAALGIGSVREKLDSGGLEIMFNRFPRAVKAVLWMADQINIKDAVNSTGSWLTQAGSTVLQGSIRQALQLALTFYLLFGTPGLVLGPVILAATLELLTIWRSRTGEPGSPQVNAPP
jgi:predicted PurR-regulated permease PerM